MQITQNWVEQLRPNKTEIKVKMLFRLGNGLKNNRYKMLHLENRNQIYRYTVRILGSCNSTFEKNRNKGWLETDYDVKRQIQKEASELNHRKQ